MTRVPGSYLVAVPEESFREYYSVKKRLEAYSSFTFKSGKYKLPPM